ncbi:MAG: rhodanese-like domain-containing protein [Saprospirales bacterium]|nr:MAG: rhodanese-like domain-containing protein [Saprospirales bacterium]
MKIFSKELSELIQKGEVILVDVRFKEEKQSWFMPFAMDINLGDLPDRHEELDREKLIVTACAVKDRSIIAMLYLRSLGYNVRYLDDGLVGFADFLKGGQARKFKEGK